MPFDEVVEPPDGLGRVPCRSSGTGRGSCRRAGRGSRGRPGGRPRCRPRGRRNGRLGGRGRHRRGRAWASGWRSGWERRRHGVRDRGRGGRGDGHGRVRGTRGRHLAEHTTGKPAADQRGRGDEYRDREQGQAEPGGDREGGDRSPPTPCARRRVRGVPAAPRSVGADGARLVARFVEMVHRHDAEPRAVGSRPQPPASASARARDKAAAPAAAPVALPARAPSPRRRMPPSSVMRKRSSSPASSAAEGWRAAGSSSSARITMASRLSGTSGRISRSGRGCTRRRSNATAAGDGPSKGRTPVRASYSTMPSE